MKGKIFKNKFVFWTVLLLNIFLLSSFSFGIYYRMQTDYFDDVLDVLSFVVINLITLLSLISLTLLIIKNKISVVVFSGVLIMMLLLFSIFIFYSVFIVKDFGENVTDFYIVPIMYFIILGILFIIHKFKYRQNLYECEIEKIGTREN